MTRFILSALPQLQRAYFYAWKTENRFLAPFAFEEVSGSHSGLTHPKLTDLSTSFMDVGNFSLLTLPSLRSLSFLGPLIEYGTGHELGSFLSRSPLLRDLHFHTLHELRVHLPSLPGLSPDSTGSLTDGALSSSSSLPPPPFALTRLNIRCPATTETVMALVRCDRNSLLGLTVRIKKSILVSDLKCHNN